MECGPYDGGIEGCGPYDGGIGGCGPYDGGMTQEGNMLHPCIDSSPSCLSL